MADIGRTDYVLRKKKESFLIVQKESHVTIGTTKHVSFLQSNKKDNSNHKLRVINYSMERELVVLKNILEFFLFIIKTY